MLEPSYNENGIRKVDSVIIPVGGYGTRLQEMTKAIPKAFLPVNEKPLIVHAVEEALQAGINRIYVPCRPDDTELFRKQFYGNGDRKRIIMQNGRDHLLDDNPFGSNVHVVPIYNKEGPASTIARIASEAGLGAFGVILPDDLIVDKNPAIGQLIEKYENTGMTCVGARRPCYDTEQPGNLTFLNTHHTDDGHCVADGVQVKPGCIDESDKNQYATCGRYVFADNFTEVIDELREKTLKEISISAVIKHYAEQDGAVGVRRLNGAKYFDCGDRVGYAKATAHFLSDYIISEKFGNASKQGYVAPERDYDNYNEPTI